MKTLSSLLAFVREIWWTLDSPKNDPVTWSFGVPLVVTWSNRLPYNWVVGDFTRYDINVTALSWDELDIKKKSSGMRNKIPQ